MKTALYIGGGIAATALLLYVIKVRVSYSRYLSPVDKWIRAHPASRDANTGEAKAPLLLKMISGNVY